jgi:hypothetical protein
MQMASTLQVQDADPADPVQLWRVAHATGAPYAQQPLLPRVQVATPPETHAVCPWLQVLLQVSAHAALGDIPEQDAGAVHVVVDATYRQLFESDWHVASVCASWQTLPDCAQIVALQEHDAVPPVTAHIW